MVLVNFSKELIEGRFERFFHGVVIITIIIAGILVGLQTYPRYADDPNVDICNNVVLAIFLVEVMLKFIAEGFAPLRYFSGPEGHWNTFDLIVVIICLPFVSYYFKESAPVIRIVSRLFRLVRVAKIVHEFPVLEVLFVGLLSGLRSIFFISMLLFLMYYVYAIIGVFFFRANDPFYFRTVPIAILTLFHATTLENWGINMKINIHGCEKYNGGIYVSRAAVTQEVWDATLPMYRCTNPTETPLVSIVYWYGRDACIKL